MNLLNPFISTKGANLNDITTQFTEFFIRRDYEWWYQVQPGDIVVDIGTCVGMFTCHALDRGAKKVYAIEPSLELLTTTMSNALPCIMNKKESPVVPINYAIGSNEKHARHVYGNVKRDEIVIKSFKEVMKEFDITHIDYLKIDCEGGEYDVLSEENLEFIKNNVKHIAVEVHLDMATEGPDIFLNFRNNFLSKFDRSKIKFMDAETESRTYDDNWIKSRQPMGWGGCWMIYICNKSLP